MQYGIQSLSRRSLRQLPLHFISRRWIAPTWRAQHSNSSQSTPAPTTLTQSQASPSPIAASTPPPPFSLKRKWTTPLAETIAKAIEVTGPISLASYMRQCLTADANSGYYTSDIDPFGKKGDFITSPEITQIFGELVAIWFLTEWLAQKRPKVQLIELGPGRGTMMSDILRTITQFDQLGFQNAIESVVMVEAGEGLRKKQAEALGVVDVKQDAQGVWQGQSSSGVTVRWVEDVALLPKPGEGHVPFIVAHEFFDALPIHAFESVAAAQPQDQSSGQQSAAMLTEGQPQADRPARPRLNNTKTTPQWRELLVAPTPPSNIFTAAEVESKPQADFQLVLAKASTPNSLVIPERERYAPLKSQPGSRVEISPESYRYVADFARRIGSFRAGAALIIDYGPANTIPVDSFRGIKDHKVISPFAFAGQADVSADVDFGALADAALEASEDVEVHGPVEQGMWLSQLGIRERAEKLVKAGEDRNEIEAGWKRLVEGGPRGMGKAYKVLTIVPENGGRRRPVGFGGNVEPVDERCQTQRGR